MSKKKYFNFLKALKIFIATFVGTLCVGAILVGINFTLGMAVTLLAFPEIVIGTIVFIKGINDMEDCVQAPHKEKVSKVVLQEEKSKGKVHTKQSCKGEKKHENENEMEM